MNKVFESKKTTIVLSVLLLFIIGVVGLLSVLVFSNYSDVDETKTPTEEVISSEIQEEVKEEPKVEQELEEIQNNVIEIETLDRVPALNLEKHPILTKEQRSAIGNTPLLGPIYEKDFRIQPIDFVRSSNKNIATFEFANTSNEEIVLTNDSVNFYLGSNGVNIAESYLENSPITVKPNQIVTFNVIARNPKASVVEVQSIKGSDAYTYFFKSFYLEEINNTEPYISEDVNGSFAHKTPKVSASYQISGDGNFKYQVKEVILTENNLIGDFNNPEGSRLVLLKLQFANTSNEEIKLNEIKYQFSNVEDFSSKDYYVEAEKVLNFIPNGFPTTIKPKTIVEGYIPAYIRDINEQSALYITTNLTNEYGGKGFIINSVGSLSPF